MPEDSAKTEQDEADEMQEISEKIALPDIERDPNDVRVAVIGNVDSGKSTLVGVLAKGQLDDGNGSARVKVFNFSHEVENGRTSSIAQEIIGFDENNDIM